MGGEEDGPALVAHLPHHFFEQMGRFRVKPHEGFIHKDELRLVEPGGNNRQLLLHAVGVGGDGLRQIGGQFKCIGVFADARLPLICAHAENVGDEIQVLDARHVVVQVGIVWDVGKAPLAFQGIFLDGHPINVDFSRVKLQNACHGF